MIKGLFFTAALLMPSLAYAGNPSANLSVQVVPAASTPPLPAGAQAAGYTTLAFHSDFTSPSYSKVANWLDCAGATTPIWFVSGKNGSPAPPCSRFSMTTDGGTQVLSIESDPGDSTANYESVLQTVNVGSNRFTQGVDFPNGAYWQITFRLLSAGVNNNPFGSILFAWWTWSDTGQTSGTAFQERDFPEIYGTGCCHNDVGMPIFNAPSGQNEIIIAGFGHPEYPIDPTIYHTLAARVTQDGSTNLAICFYIDNVFQNCGDMVSAGNTRATAITSSQLNQRNFPIIQIGTGQSSGTTPVIALIKDVQIWTCAGWQGPLNKPGNACNGPVLTGAP